MSKKTGIERLISESGPYARWSLEQRREFMELRLDQEQDIKEMYENMSRRIAQEVARGNLSTFDEARLKRVQLEIRDRIDELNNQLAINFDRYIHGNVEAGSGYAKKVAIDLVERAGVTRLNKPLIEEAFFRLNKNAVEGMWTRSRYGLKLNNQIWNKNENYRKHINSILTTGVATGEDCVTVARALERYVKNGRGSLAENYPNMMERMQGRVPKDISYEALRLARTEMTSAFGMGTMKSSSLNPANQGVRFILSASHPEYDICDVHCNLDEYGLGPGGYPLDEAPDYPFHPNCLCIMTQINEEPEDLLARLKEWDSNPTSHPDLEEWYQENYSQIQF